MGQVAGGSQMRGTETNPDPPLWGRTHGREPSVQSRSSSLLSAAARNRSGDHPQDSPKPRLSTDVEIN